MNDVEIESLLDEAGYEYDAASRGYSPLGADEDTEVIASIDIADELQIPLDDLLRWEEEQQQIADRD